MAPLGLFGLLLTPIRRTIEVERLGFIGNIKRSNGAVRHSVSALHHLPSDIDSIGRALANHAAIQIVIAPPAALDGAPVDERGEKFFGFCAAIPARRAGLSDFGGIDRIETNMLFADCQAVAIDGARQTAEVFFKESDQAGYGKKSDQRSDAATGQRTPF